MKNVEIDLQILQQRMLYLDRIGYHRLFLEVIDGKGLLVQKSDIGADL